MFTITTAAPMFKITTGKVMFKITTGVPMFKITTGSAYVHDHYWVPVVRITLLVALKQVAGLALALADGYLKRKVWISMEQDA